MDTNYDSTVQSIIEQCYSEVTDCIHQYERGIYSKCDLKTNIEQIIIDGYIQFFRQNGIRVSFSETSYKSFIENYNRWLNAEELKIEESNLWISTLYTDAVDNIIKLNQLINDFFSLITSFKIPTEYFKPVPDDVITPDKHPGYLYSDLIVGWRIWKTDGGLLSDDDPIGKTFTLTDHYNLKTKITILMTKKQMREKDDPDYIGTGYIEGYTTTDEHEIKIFVDDKDMNTIRSLYSRFSDEDNDYFNSYPLWQKHFEIVKEKENLWSSAVDRLIEMFSDKPSA